MKKTLFITVLAMFLLVSMVSAIVPTTDWTYVDLTDNDGNEQNLDIAVDDFDVVHRVYERDGMIYYSNSKDNKENEIDSGVQPAIAVGPQGDAWIIYIKSGDLMIVSLAENAEKFESIFSGVVSADIAVDDKGKPYVVYEANYDTSGDSYKYNDIVLTTGPNENTVLFTGWYWYENGGKAGRYYDSPKIAVDSNGKYHVAVHHTAVDGSIGWTETAYYLLYKTNAGTGLTTNTPYKYKTNRQIYRNSITVDDLNNPHMVYTTSGNVIYASPSPTWTETTINAGSFAAIDATDVVGIVFENAGQIFYTENSGLGFNTPEFVDEGFAPALALGSVNINYLDVEGSDYDVFEAYMDRTNGQEIPEFGVVAAGLALVGAVAGFAVMRRKQ